MKASYLIFRFPFLLECIRYIIDSNKEILYFDINGMKKFMALNEKEKSVASNMKLKFSKFLKNQNKLVSSKLSYFLNSLACPTFLLNRIKPKLRKQFVQVVFLNYYT